MKWVKTTITIGAGLGIILVIFIVWRGLNSNNDSVLRTIVAERRDIVQDVTFTGMLSAKQSVDLGFELAGLVQEVLVGVGDKVEAGQTLVRLDTRTAKLERAKTLADRASAVEEARLAWDKTKVDRQNTQAVDTRTVAKKRQAVIDAKAEVEQAKQVHARTSDEDGSEAATTESAFATVATKESAYHAAQEALAEEKSNEEKSNAAAQATADIAQAEYLATKQAAPGVAGLSSLRAAEQLSQVKLAKSVITAPFTGVVTAREVEPGEVISAASVVLTLATTDLLEVIAQVPETDAAKIKTSMTATLTFDVLPATEQFTAQVISIAPAAVIIEGVPTYEIKLSLTSTDERLKPGLTTNIIAQAGQRNNVIAVPRRAIINRGDQQFVRLLNSNNEISEQAITSGLVGSNGQVEITSGLSGGEAVVVSTLETQE